MTEVLPAIREPDQLERSLASVEQTVRFAEIIAPTHFVPGGLRGKPDEIHACVMLGRELGLGPMRSLSWVILVDGRPSLYAEGVRALILARGHELRVTEWTKTRCVLAGRRAGSSDWQEVTYTIDDAKQAGLAGKPTWRAYPQEMLLARATARHTLRTVHYPHVRWPGEIRRPPVAVESPHVGRAVLQRGLHLVEVRRRRHPTADAMPRPRL